MAALIASGSQAGKDGPITKACKPDKRAGEQCQGGVRLIENDLNYYLGLNLDVPARDNLKEVQRYALVKHYRVILIRCVQSERLAKLEINELNEIVHRLQHLVDW